MRARHLALAVGAALGLLGGGAARAGSGILLPLPESFGQIEAGTFDTAGQRVGEARMSVVRRPDGRVELEARSGIDGSARSSVSAVMELAEDGKALRLVSQRSESFDTSGASLGVLAIDHGARVASCGAAPGSEAPDTSLELPASDHVVNVPLNLLFQRLVTGETEEISFQVLLCRFGARLFDAHARLAGPAAGQNGLVEVRYQLDLGPLLSPMAAPFLPTLSFWFDRDEPGAWVAHRMPLFSQGPTVLVVRSGISPTRLEPDVAAAGGL
jgi:hypothetical protein